MTLKLLDIQYLRAQNTGNGQVLITGSSFGVEQTSTLVIKNGMVGIGTTIPSDTLTVNGNIRLVGVGSQMVFADNTVQSTAAVTMLPGGVSGSVQFNSAGSFGGNEDLFWDTSSNRLGIGTSVPRSTLQIRDVGYESTNTSTSDTTEIVLDSFPVPDYRSCHYIVQVTDENYSWFHTTQIMLIHDGIQAFKSEYNIVTTQEKLGSFDCRIDSGNVELTFTAFYTSDKNIKVIRTSIEP
jgi:hypothetical protein